MEKKKTSFSRKLTCALLKALLWVTALLVCLLCVSIVGYVLMKGLPHITWQLLSTKPSYLTDTIGILPDLVNTLYVVAATLLFVLPLGVGAAVYLTEYAQNRKFVALIEAAAETLSGIPSILYGLVGMLVFCEVLGLKTSLLAGSLTLVIMNLPTILRTTQESLRAVEPGLRESALALGAGKWHMIRTVVLPNAIDGILTGCILATGRILGESAALLFTAGFSHALNGIRTGLKSSGATLTVALYVYAKEQGKFEVAFAIAAVLMVLTLLLNALAAAVGALLKRRTRV